MDHNKIGLNRFSGVSHVNRARKESLKADLIEPKPLSIEEAREARLKEEAEDREKLARLRAEAEEYRKQLRKI